VVFRLLFAASLFLGSLVLGSTPRLAAQQIEIQHKVDLYRPTRISWRDGALQIQQKVGVKVGAGIAVVFNRRFDVATAVSYIPGYAILRGAGKQFEVATASQVVAASVGARYWLMPDAGSFSWEIHTGVGTVSGGQPAYDRLFDGATLSGSLGTMLQYQIGRIVSLQLKIQQRLYRIYFGNEDPGGSSKPLRASFAVSFPFLQSLLSTSGDESGPAGYVVQ
jgi:hypothetical protein